VKVIEDGDGTMTAVFETDLGEQPIDQFVPQWAQSDIGKHFLMPASGGGAGGSDGHKRSSNLTTNPFSKGAWNMTNQARLIKESPDKADSFAKMAGHSNGAAGAKLENAK
jgi:hypothetical protein